MSTVDNDTPGTDQRLEEILAAYLEACDAGWAPDRGHLFRCYPDLRAELQAFFDDYDRVDCVAASFRTLTGAGTATPPVQVPAAGSTAEPPNTVWDLSPADPLPRQFGRYTLLEVIARGGMGVVYKAREGGAGGRLVAVKMVLAAGLTSPVELQRFRLEAETTAQMEHPNIVPIYDVGTVQERHYFTMKLVEGGSLAAHLDRFAGSPGAAVALLLKVAGAVHYAHQRGVLHRDLKPGNILLDGGDEPLVTDFGLAKRFAADADLTQTGAILGTPSYMAPEQTYGKRGALTTATDVYSLGAVLYALLTGQPPFRGETPLDTVTMLRNDRPAPPSASNPGVPRDLELICLKCLEKSPSRRYPSAEAFADDLRRWQNGERVSVRPLTRGEKFLRRVRQAAAVASALFVSLLLLAGMGFLFLDEYLPRAGGPTAAQPSPGAADRSGELRLALRQAEEAKAAERQVAAAASKEASDLEARLKAEEEKLRAELGAKMSRAGAGVKGTDAFPAASPPAFPATPSPAALSGNGVGNTVVTPNSGYPAPQYYLPPLDRRESTPGQARDADQQQRFRSLAQKLQDKATVVAGSADGKYLGTVDEEGEPKLWDADSGQLLQTFPRVKDVQQLVVSPEGKWVACVREDGEVKVWDRTGRKQGAAADKVRGVAQVTFSPDGRRLACVTKDNRVRVWDLGGEGLVEVPESKQPPVTVQFSDDGQSLVLGVEGPKAFGGGTPPYGYIPPYGYNPYNPFASNAVDSFHSGNTVQNLQYPIYNGQIPLQATPVAPAGSGGR